MHYRWYMSNIEHFHPAVVVGFIVLFQAGHGGWCSMEVCIEWTCLAVVWHLFSISAVVWETAASTAPYMSPSPGSPVPWDWVQKWGGCCGCPGLKHSFRAFRGLPEECCQHKQPSGHLQGTMGPDGHQVRGWRWEGQKVPGLTFPQLNWSPASATCASCSPKEKCTIFNETENEAMMYLVSLHSFVFQNYCRIFLMPALVREPCSVLLPCAHPCLFLEMLCR